MPIVYKGIWEKGGLKRKYYGCVLIDLYFRGIPQAIGGGRYAFGGRTEVVFRGYALNEDELKKLDQKLGENDVSDALKLVSGLTEDSLKQLEDDIKGFLEEKKDEKKGGEKREESTNPFFALLGIGGKKKEEKKEEKKAEKKPETIKEVKPDNFYEKEIRKVAEAGASKNCFDLFDIYKKAHGMPSHPSPFG